MEIIDFYNQGAQVQIPTQTSDMTHSFTSGDGDGEPLEIGYEPKGNAKLVEGPSHDIIEHDGRAHLLLKEGYIYDVVLENADDNGQTHVISAEQGHTSLPLPTGVTGADVQEHDPDAAVADEGTLGSDESAATDKDAGDEQE